MQPLTRCTVVLSLLAFLGTLSAPRLLAQTSSVRCEARGTSQQTCPIPANSRVELTRTLSQEACREGRNWGVSPGFIWVALGCRAEFAVTSVGYEPGPGNATANPNQLRACRSEADRRLAAYSYDQISVEPDSRQGSVAYVRWWVGPMSGLCAVAANGRVLQFTNHPVSIGSGPTTRLVCESQRYGREECGIPAGASIRLLRQIGQDPCRLNDTYGQGAGYIWVAKGCRGEFEVVMAGGGPGFSRVVCASSLNTRRQCAIPPGAKARLARQMSEVPCRTGQNWGVGADYVWVARGCSGEFEVSGGGGGWQGGNGGGTSVRRIVCESRTAAQVVCPVAGATAVRLLKQYSTNPCALDRSFGVGFGHVWVSSGCRGEFEVVTGGTPPGAGGGNGTGLPERVVCESRGGERVECRIRVGGQVRLVRQISTIPCTANNTWGSGYGMIWVTKGCRGEFEVQ
jgi:Protein of unknown function (DUF3011)